MENNIKKSIDSRLLPPIRNIKDQPEKKEENSNQKQIFTKKFTKIIIYKNFLQKKK